MKEKFKTTSFWLGLCGSIVLILESVSSLLGISLYPQVVETIILSVCSILVTIGIITKKNVNDKDNSSKDDLLNEIEDIKINDDNID